MTKSPMRYHGRGPVISTPGLLLFARTGSIVSNGEAIGILCYPGKPLEGQTLTSLVADRLPRELLEFAGTGSLCINLLSGRRRYVCTRHDLEMSGAKEKSVAIL